MSLDGYFHLWKAENNLCKVRAGPLKTPPLLFQLAETKPLRSDATANPQFGCLFLPASVH